MKYFLGRWFGNLAYLISNCLSWLGNFRGIEIKGFICSPVMCNIVSIGGKLLVWNSESPFAKVLSLSLSLSLSLMVLLHMNSYLLIRKELKKQVKFERLSCLAMVLGQSWIWINEGLRTDLSA